MNFEPLIQVTVGGALAIAGGVITQLIGHRRERRSIAHAFAGEIGAILSIMEERHYEAGLKKVVEQVRQERKAYEFRIGARQHYFAVYESNAQKLGILERNLAEGVAKFYTFLKALLEDVSDAAIPRPDPEECLEHLERLLKLLIATVALGRQTVLLLQRV